MGETYVANFGQDLVFQLKFESIKEEEPQWETDGVMGFAGVAGHNQGISERERITVTPLRPAVFMITWQDGTGNTYVQVADFEQESVYLNLTLPDNLEETNTKLIYLEGSLTRVLSDESRVLSEDGDAKDD